MMAPIREDKPAWSAVPRTVREETQRILGAKVVRAVRAYGGYGPSATYTLTLDDGRRVFFKGVYPLREGSDVRWSLDEEERVYRELSDWVEPWAPEFFGSIRTDGWHALVIEAVRGARVPPWTDELARSAARSYADFHGRTLGKQLPRWIPRGEHREFGEFWANLSSDAEAVERLLHAARRSADEAERWVTNALPALMEAETWLLKARRPFALLHSDTRSDNIRIDAGVLRMFDWPFAFIGPLEFDLAAFAQSVASEGGPLPEQIVGWYSEVLQPRRRQLVGSAVGIAGYFANRAPRPPLEGLPRLRSVQRRQLKASLRWAARLLKLPEPGWLSDVAD